MPETFSPLDCADLTVAMISEGELILLESKDLMMGYFPGGGVRLISRRVRRILMTFSL